MLANLYPSFPSWQKKEQDLSFSQNSQCASLSLESQAFCFKVGVFQSTSDAERMAGGSKDYPHLISHLVGDTLT